MRMPLAKLRPRTWVQQDFSGRGVGIGFWSSGHLARYSDQAYAKVLIRAEALAKSHGISGLRAGRPGTFSEQALDEIPDQTLVEGCLDGEVLDLRGIEKFWQRRKAEFGRREFLEGQSPDSSRVPDSGSDKVRALLEIMSDERTAFERLIDSPDATPARLFRILAGGVKKLNAQGFNVTILRPDEREGITSERCSWVEYCRTGKSREGADPSPIAKLPADTLRSILGSREARFRVNLEDPSSFNQYGLDYKPSDMAPDLERSKGSPEVLIYKLESTGHEVIAVVCIHNRVSRDSFNDPSQELLPPGDARPIAEALSQYFDMAIRAFNAINRRRKALLASDPIGKESPIDDAALIQKIRENSSLLRFGDEEIRLVELPSEKLYYERGALVRAYRELILSIYRGSEEYRGCGDDEISRALSLDNQEEVSRKTFLARYLVVIIRQNRLLGVASGTVEDHVPGIGKVFEVPVAMIGNEVGAKGRLTYVSLKMMLREFWKKWIDLGLVRGFLRMCFEGVPIFVWTQSKRVIKAMLELQNLWLPVAGAEIPDKAKCIVDYFSEKHDRSLDDNLIARNAYRGRIALSRQEQFKLRRKGVWGWLERLFMPRRCARIDALIDGLGERDAVPVIGYFTLGVAIRVILLMKFRKIYRNIRGRGRDQD